MSMSEKLVFLQAKAALGTKSNANVSVPPNDVSK